MMLRQTCLTTLAFMFGLVAAQLDSSPDEVVNTSIPLTVFNSTSLKSIQRGTTKVYALVGGQAWGVNLQIGNPPQSIPLYIDTGSSDTWAVTPGYVCKDVNTGVVLNYTDLGCRYGPTYAPGSDFHPIANENLNIVYGDGSYAQGIPGKVSVTLAGITVTQQISIATTVARQPDTGAPIGSVSGILGFAFPAIEFTFNGTNLTADTGALQAVYDPIFTTMWKLGKIPPKFSLAVSRPTRGLPGGYLAFGGLPPVDGEGRWAGVPIEYQNISAGVFYYQGSQPYPQFQWYTFYPDGYQVDSTFYPLSASPGGYYFNEYMTDSGSTLIYLSTDVAYAAAAAYDPPAVWNQTLIPGGVFTVACNATAPEFLVKIGGVSFPVDKRDLILDDGTGSGGCISAISDCNGNTPCVLGGQFLRNVIAVHDVGNLQLRFQSRGQY